MEPESSKEEEVNKEPERAEEQDKQQIDDGDACKRQMVEEVNES